MVDTAGGWRCLSMIVAAVNSGVSIENTASSGKVRSKNRQRRQAGSHASDSGRRTWIHVNSRQSQPMNTGPFSGEDGP
jgi:hypothetical protein